MKLFWCFSLEKKLFFQLFFSNALFNLSVLVSRDNQGRVDVVGRLPKLKKVIVLIDDETTLVHKELTM